MCRGVCVGVGLPLWFLLNGIDWRQCYCNNMLCVVADRVKLLFLGIVIVVFDTSSDIGVCFYGNMWS